jgi:hypothetical protein
LKNTAGKYGMLTVIDGQGESSQHNRSIQINGAGLIDISTTKITLVTEQHQFEKALEDLNDRAKERLYKGLQNEIANCFKISSALLKNKRVLIGKGDGQEAEIASEQCQKLRLKERALWKQIKKLYELINATQ